MNNIYYNKNMNLVFVGDCMFGRDGNEFVTDPFVNVEHILKKADYVFLNLETTISNPLLSNENKVDKVFNYQSNGDQLLSLKKYILYLFYLYDTLICKFVSVNNKRCVKVVRQQLAQGRLA